MANAAQKPFVSVHRVLITVSGQCAYSYFCCMPRTGRYASSMNTILKIKKWDYFCIRVYNIIEWLKLNRGKKMKVGTACTGHLFERPYH